MSLKISGLVVSRNEGSKLADCLASLAKIATELVVIDLQSTDQTAAVAAEYKARVISHTPVDYVEKIRQWSIDQCVGEWVVLLDPDERLSDGLIEKLTEVAKNDQYVAINIPRKNIFFGQWIKHTNFWPDRHLRFFKRAKINWPDRIHTYPQLDGDILTLPADSRLAIIHYGYDSWADFWRRQLRYGRVEARNRWRSGERFSVIALIWRPMREFLARYIKHQGYKDGINGLFLVICLMVYQVMTEFRLLWRPK